MMVFSYRGLSLVDRVDLLFCCIIFLFGFCFATLLFLLSIAFSSLFLLFCSVFVFLRGFSGFIFLRFENA